VNDAVILWSVLVCAQIVAIGYLMRAGAILRALVRGDGLNRRRHSLARWLPLGGTLRGPGWVDSGRRDRLRVGAMGSGS